MIIRSVDGDKESMDHPCSGDCQWQFERYEEIYTHYEGQRNPCQQRKETIKCQT